MTNLSTCQSRRVFFGSIAMLAVAAGSDNCKANDKLQLRAYESALDILNDLPEKLKPATKVGWDKYRFEEVGPWLTKEPVGRRFESRFKIDRAYVEKVPMFGRGERKWKLRYDFVDRSFRFRGIGINEGIHFASVKRPTLVGDEAFARRAEKVPAGHNVAVTGIIRSIHLWRIYPPLKLSISLDEVVISSSIFDSL